MTKGDFTLPLGHNMISDIKINKLSKTIAASKDINKVFIRNVYLNREIENNEDGFFLLMKMTYPNFKQTLNELNNCIVTY